MLLNFDKLCVHSVVGPNATWLFFQELWTYKLYDFA